ncbi:translation initiation factor [Stigmatella aurantiaca]|nr:translation initiation factor [Stigmatella aurantiaca]ADO71146.1 Sui1 family protein [Stigmatella aurantiaca DW4/3-1]
MARGKHSGSGAPPKADEPEQGYRDPKDKGRFHNPFAALASQRAAVPGAQPQIRAEDFPLTPPTEGPAQAVLRLEQRGGQEVTLVEGLGLAPPEMQAWLEALQRGLGCYGEVAAATLVLKGDHRRTAPDLLLRRGVKRVRQG